MMHSTDFSKGKVWQNIVAQSIPLILAQLVQLLYNVVDRIYIGHLPGADSMALTGIGLVFPLTTLIAAFTFLFGTGGTPLFPLRGERGRRSGQEKYWAIRFRFCLPHGFPIPACGSGDRDFLKRLSICRI